MSASYIFVRTKDGNTYEGASFAMSLNDAPMTLTSASITMNVNANGVNVPFSTLNNKLTITSASSFEFNKQIVDFWSRGTFPYEIVFQFPNGDIKTYITGTWEIF